MLTTNWMAQRQKPLPIGVDIGHRCIKMVQLAQADGRIRVLAVQRAPLAMDAWTDEQHRRRVVVSTMKQMLSHRRFKGRQAVSALSGDELRITSVRLPETEAMQADKALQREAAQRFDVDPEEDTIGYILAGNVRQDDEAKDEFIVLAAGMETIASHIAMLEEAGLRPVGIDAAPCALFRGFERALRREEDKQRTTIFMDIGHAGTTVVFGRSAEICLIKQMPFGMRRFDEEIASRLEVGLAEAEGLRLKLQRGECLDAAMHHLVTDALTTTAEQLARELSLCLRYHTVTFRGKRVVRAVVAGGGAHEGVLLEVLRRHLSISIETADPLRGFDRSGIGSDNDGVGCVDLALAVGLSLKGQRPASHADEPSRRVPEPVLEGERS